MPERPSPTNTPYLGTELKSMTHSDSVSNEPFLSAADRVAASPAGSINGAPYREMSAEESAGADEGKLGVGLGVMMPCMMSIFGVILFLRLGWVVGQAGLWGSLGILFISSLVAFLTILSLSALSTNGEVGPGGLYYVISRALGCEFGGSIGVIFYSANVAAGALYITGFSETLITTLGIDWGGEYKTKLVLSVSSYLLLLLIALAGARWFARAIAFILIPVMLAIFASMVSMVAESPGKIEGFTGFNVNTLKSNMGFSFTPMDESDPNSKLYDIRTVFGVYFPAATGIMAGANMSGDLRNPARAIPKGTISAFLLCSVIYAMLIIFFAATFDTETLHKNKLAFQDIAFWPPFITVGICASTLSSALSALVGGSRIIQALGRDKMFPGAATFAVGSGPLEEPRRAVCLTFAIILGLVLIGDLNVLAGIVTMFFLMSYAVVNLAVFILRISGAPNFRPLFRFFTWHTALLGTIFCVVTMFITDPVIATISLAVLVMVFVGVHFTAPSNTWGSISQALMYHQIRKYLLRLDTRKDHVKYWRPQLLLFVDRAPDALNLLDFANDLKKGGLFVVGHTVIGEFDESKEKVDLMKNALDSLVRMTRMKAFPEVTAAPDFRHGAQALLMHSGIGAMRPNTVIFGFPSRGSVREKGDSVPGPAYNPYTDAADVIDEINAFETSPAPTLGDYFGAVRDAVKLGKNVLIARHFSNLDKSVVLGFHHYHKKRPHRSTFAGVESSSSGIGVGAMSSNGGEASSLSAEMMTIDVWLSLADGDWDPVGSTELLLMQLAFILSNTDVWKKHSTIRILAMCDGGAAGMERTKARLRETMHTVRIPSAETIAVDVGALSTDGVTVDKTFGSTREEAINQILIRHSKKTGVVFLPLPDMPAGTSEEDHERFCASLSALTKNAPPTMFVKSSAERVVFVGEN